MRKFYEAPMIIQQMKDAVIFVMIQDPTPRSSIHCLPLIIVMMKAKM